MSKQESGFVLPGEAAPEYRAAAMEYVEHGWGVVAGSVWDGRFYTLGHAVTPTAGLVPVWGSGRTVRDVRRVWARWSMAPYSVLARAGEDFDVITAPTCVAVLATGMAWFARELCPVSLAPDGVRLLVAKGAELGPVLAAVPGVQMAAPGTVVPLPPTRMQGGSVTWWVPPTSAGWRVGDPAAAQQALILALSLAHGGGDRGA